MKDELIAWLVIIGSVTAAELVLWGFTHNWFNSLFAAINAFVVAILSIVFFVAAFALFKEEADR